MRLSSAAFDLNPVLPGSRPAPGASLGWIFLVLSNPQGGSEPVTAIFPLIISVENSPAEKRLPSNHTDPMHTAAQGQATCGGAGRRRPGLNPPKKLSTPLSAPRREGQGREVTKTSSTLYCQPADPITPCYCVAFAGMPRLLALPKAREEMLRRFPQGERGQTSVARPESAKAWIEHRSAIRSRQGQTRLSHRATWAAGGLSGPLVFGQHGHCA